MDFLDPKKKRAHQIRLYIGYALMAFALIIGSAVLFFEARGFDINRKTGEVIQNGLVFANAHPESADVYVNGKREGQTDLRLAIPAGDYTFEFVRSGYRTWKRTFALGGSEIERLNYAFLFPEKLEPAEVRPYASAPAFATQSPDRQWLIVQQIGKLAAFDVVSLGQTNNPVTPITLPANLVNTTAGSDAWELVEWSTDNRHVLIRHTFKGGSEFVMLDRERPAESLNLNKHFTMTLYKAALRDKKFDKLHLLDKNGGTLRFGDSKSKQLSVVASKVSAFKSYGDEVVFYVGSEGAKKGTVHVNIRKGRDTFKVRDLPAGKQYSLDITRYDDEWFMAVGTDTDKRAYVYHEVFGDLEQDNPKVPAPIAVFRMQQPLDAISVSANTRFISIQSGSEFGVYDAEHDRRYQYDTKLKLAASQKAEWMDGHRLAVVTKGTVNVWDYDGINIQSLVAAHPAFVPFFDRDYDNLYTLSPSANAKGKTSLLKTPMRIPSDL
ncbi:MAG TPA: PEGA domain-containing protein [Candidatus Limnocylindria bacterium]|nr:PEGA domain-containing protein [Candidatus Limnocylindria bacterium]